MLKLMPMIILRPSGGDTLHPSDDIDSANIDEQHNSVLTIFDPRTWDWKHLGDRLKSHENSVEHLTNMNTWNELRLRLSKNKNEMQREIAKEKKRWRQVLVRIDSAIKFLAKQNLAF